MNPTLKKMQTTGKIKRSVNSQHLYDYHVNGKRLSTISFIVHPRLSPKLCGSPTLDLFVLCEVFLTLMCWLALQFTQMIFLNWFKRFLNTIDNSKNLINEWSFQLDLCIGEQINYRIPSLSLSLALMINILQINVSRMYTYWKCSACKEQA